MSETRKGRRRWMFAVSWGPSGGLYVHRGFCKRICFWRLAFTLLPIEIDDLMEAYAADREPRDRDLGSGELAEIKSFEFEIDGRHYCAHASRDQSRERPKPCPKCGVASDYRMHMRDCSELWLRGMGDR